MALLHLYLSVMSEFEPRREISPHAAFDAYVDVLGRLLPPQFEVMVTIRSGNVVRQSDITRGASQKGKASEFLRLFLERGGDILKIKTYLQEKGINLASALPDTIPSFPRDVRPPQPEAELTPMEKAYAQVLCRLLPPQMERLVRFEIRTVDASQLPMELSQTKIAEAFVRMYFKNGGDAALLKKILTEKVPTFAKDLP